MCSATWSGREGSALLTTLECEGHGFSTTVDVDSMELEQLQQVERGELSEPHGRCQEAVIAFTVEVVTGEFDKQLDCEQCYNLDFS